MNQIKFTDEDRDRDELDPSQMGLMISRQAPGLGSTFQKPTQPGNERSSIGTKGRPGGWAKPRK